MAKRKKQEEKILAHGGDVDDESSDEDMTMVDVDFEWFDPKPEVDFHGLKTLCRQLFDTDAQLFDLSELVDIILSQPMLGSTVKVDGNETDPYAFLTVLNLHVHREKPVVQALTEYLIQKSTTIPSLYTLSTLLAPSSSAQVGLILTERLINMPSEITPPMYTMLLQEMQWAIDEKEPYAFSHYLIISKVYREVESKLDGEESGPAKKKKRRDGDEERETFYFHIEDEVLHKHALGFGSFDYSKERDEGAADAKRAFLDVGIEPKGHMILVEAGKFESAVEAVVDYVKS